jgi:hypothetical protein
VNGTLHFLCVAIYLGTAPLLLAVRALRPKLMPWWLVVALSAGFGWLLSILSAYFSLRYFYDTHPWSLVTTWDPSRRWGWLSGLIYLSLWLGPYWFLVVRRRKSQMPVVGRLPNQRLERP